MQNVKNLLFDTPHCKSIIFAINQLLEDAVLDPWFMVIHMSSQDVTLFVCVDCSSGSIKTTCWTLAFPQGGE